MILYATIILLIFDLIVFVVNLIKIEKTKKENEELKKDILEKKEFINFLVNSNDLLRRENVILEEKFDRLYDTLDYHLERIEK